jgi:uncharacterized protein
MVPARMSVVTLGVRDLPRMRAFYEGLGWTVQQYDDDFARCEVGGGVLTMYRLSLLAHEANMPVLDDTESFRGFTLAIVCEAKEMVDPAMDAVRQAGGRILAEAVDRDFGGYSGYWADPEGNAWEIVWMPGATFDNRNGLIWPT